MLAVDIFPFCIYLVCDTNDRTHYLKSGGGNNKCSYPFGPREFDKYRTGVDNIPCMFTRNLGWLDQSNSCSQYSKRRSDFVFRIAIFLWNI